MRRIIEHEGATRAEFGYDPAVPHPSIISRRAFLTNTVTIAAGSRFWGNRAQRSGTRLILLGTGGGPRPRATSSASAQVIVSNNVAYVIDCGDGVARQLAFAGVPLPTVRHVFITHQHSDHNADYGNLIWLAWAAGLNTRVDTWGPPPLEKMTALFFEMNAYDIATRIANEGRPALRPSRSQRRSLTMRLSFPHSRIDSTLAIAPSSFLVTPRRPTTS
jgi:metallo-beta-lactamase superfamily protein